MTAKPVNKDEVAKNNKKTPESVSLPDKFSLPDYFIISHTKPSISKNTARKMLENYINRTIQAQTNPKREE